MRVVFCGYTETHDVPLSTVFAAVALYTAATFRATETFFAKNMRLIRLSAVALCAIAAFVLYTIAIYPAVAPITSLAYHEHEVAITLLVLCTFSGATTYATSFLRDNHLKKVN